MAKKSRVLGEWGQKPENAYAIPLTRYHRIVETIDGKRYCFGVRISDDAFDFISEGPSVGYIWVDKDDEWVLLSLSERKALKRTPGLIEHIISKAGEMEVRRNATDSISNNKITDDYV